jgi:hypothetical protein
MPIFNSTPRPGRAEVPIRFKTSLRAIPRIRRTAGCNGAVRAVPPSCRTCRHRQYTHLSTPSNTRRSSARNPSVASSNRAPHHLGRKTAGGRRDPWARSRATAQGRLDLEHAVQRRPGLSAKAPEGRLRVRCRRPSAVRGGAVPHSRAGTVDGPRLIADRGTNAVRGRADARQHDVVRHARVD